MILHSCFEVAEPRYKNFESVKVLETTSWEFTIEKCIGCGQSYLKAFCETVGYSRSGRWAYGAIVAEFDRTEPEEQVLLAFLHGLPQLFYGGSAFGHAGKWAIKDPSNSPLYQVLANAIWDPKYRPRD